MIRFVHDDREYTINFCYKQKDDVSPLYIPDSFNALTDLEPWDKKHGCIVVCTLMEGAIDSKDDDKGWVAHGLAFQHPNDRFVKETGRRIALEDALGDFHRKGFRKAAWEAYFSRNSADVAAKIAVS